MKTNSRKILSLLLYLALAVVLSTASISASATDTYGTWDEVADAAAEGTDYTMDADGNMKIHTAAGLAYFAKQVNDGANVFSGKTVVLTDDIALTDSGVTGYSGTGNAMAATVTEDNRWPAIGTATYQFTGTFDGQGHTVSGVYINAGSSKGLFGQTASSSVIQNVGVINSHIIGFDLVGGVVGYNDGTVQNCYNTGAVSGDSSVGGVVGDNWGTVQNCYNTGAVSGDGSVGGVVGDNWGTVQNCYFLEGSATNGIGFGGNGTAADMTEAQMQSPDFVNTLSGWVIDEGNTDLKLWVAQAGDYPIFGKIFTTWDSVVNNAAEGTDYTIKSDDNIQIHTAKGLAYFAQQVNDGANVFAGKTVVLTDDIDLTTAGVTGYSGTGNVMDATVTEANSWPAIGTSTEGQRLEGTFDGQGHTVSGVYIANSGKGLFGHTAEDTVIQNVGVINSHIIGFNWVGGVVGINDGTVQNCYNTGAVSGSNRVGGVVGLNSGSDTVQNCYNTGTVSATGNFIGGVVGENYGTAQNCYNTGAVSGDSDVGGVVGYNFYSGTVQDCYFLEDSATNGIGSDNGTATGMSKTQMQAPDFVTDKLNDWVSRQSSTALSSWLAQGSDYPILEVFTTTWEDVAVAAVDGTDYTLDSVTGNMEIHTAAGLAYFAKQVNDGTNIFTGKTVVLTDDIALTDAGVTSYSGTGNVMDATVTEANSWPAIGTNTPGQRLEGTFDGQGHTVSGVYINAGSSKGLFGQTASDTVIQNVGVINSHIIGFDNLGGVVGLNRGTVQNCYNTGAVSGDSSVGGVVGDNYSTVQNCYFLQGSAINGIGIGDGTATDMTEAQMQSPDFVNTLNTWVLDNKATISGLYHWLQITDTSYPTLKEAYTVTTTNASVDGYIGFVFAGETVTLTPNEVATFDSFTVTPSTVVITNNSFTMPNEDVTIVANYKNILPQTLSFAQDEVKKTVGDDKFINTLAGVKTTVIYTSTNEDVAKVNAQTGEVIIISAGTASIVATASADSTYDSATTSYSLTVNSVKALTFDDITDYIASFDGDFDELAKIYFNGVELKLKVVDADTYELYGYPAGSSTIIGKAERGSIIVTLYEEFLRTLPAGDYDLSVTFSGEQVETTGTTIVSIPEGAPASPTPAPASPTPAPTALPETDSNLPPTGDDSNITIWVTLLFISLSGTLVVAKKKLLK